MKKNLEIKNYIYIPTTYILYAGIMNYIYLPGINI